MHVGSAKSQHWFYMKGMDYMSYSQYTRKCTILVKPEIQNNKTQSVWLMGDPFLRTYYSIYDMENNRIGLVGIAETERIKMQTLASRMNDRIDKILEKIGIDE